MAKLIRKVDGKKAYIGLLTPEELKEADKLEKYLESFIPELEAKLQKKHKGRNVYYAYEFGCELKKLVDKFHIKGIQEKIFWDQIRHFASKAEDKPKDRSENRKVYDYYYRLSSHELDSVKNINWGEWSQLFDTKEIIKEERIISWLVEKAKQCKIKRDPFRKFLTGVRLFIKNKDTSVFTDDQLFEKYEMIFTLTLIHNELYDKYFTSQKKKPTEARLKKPKKYQEKYFSEVFTIHKKDKELDLEIICDKVFKEVYFVRD